MKYISFNTSKNGVELEKGEDALAVRQIGKHSLLIIMSDGASTGVFSHDWAHHITSSFDSAWMRSVNDFTFGMGEIRKSFKPVIERPTALRKFLMEGSYATIFAARIAFEKKLFRQNAYHITTFSIGDITTFVFSPDGTLEYSYPNKKSGDYNNVPALFRSSAKLQEKSPVSVMTEDYSTPASNTLVFATDAMSEYIFELIEADGKDAGQVKNPEMNGNDTAESHNPRINDLISKIKNCPGQQQFTELIDACRGTGKMKNDDVTILMIIGE